MTGHDSAVSCSCASRRSDWPGLMRAGSSVSIRLVAMMTLTSPRESKPSSWLSSSNMVLWISRSPPELESYLEIAETFTWRRYRTAWWLDCHMMSDPIGWRVHSHHWTPIHYYTSQHATKVLRKTVLSENICQSNEDTFKNRTVTRVAEVQQSACCCVKTINNSSSSSILKLLTPRHLWNTLWDASTACRCPLCLTPLQKQLEIPFGANGVDLINENDGGCVLLGYPEELSHQLGPVSQVLLDQLRAHHTQEGGWSLVGHSFGEQRLACM